MARDAVAITELTLNGGTDEPAGTTINVSNGAYVAAGGNTDKLLLIVRNTNASARVVTIPAGVGPTAALGDLAVTVAANTGVELIVLESARFAQSDGNINIDFAASFAGTVACLRLPDGV